LRDRPVALIASDQRMPEMTGVAFLEQAKEHAPEAKLVLLTAYADTDVAIKAINDIGLDYYLLKPWDPPDEKLYPVFDDLLSDWHEGHRIETVGMRVVGDRWSEQSNEVKTFLARNYVPYRWLDIERDEEARKLIDLANATEADPSARAHPGRRHPARAVDARSRGGTRPANERRTTTVRPVHRRRRPGRARRRGLRSLGGTGDGGDRAPGSRGAGGAKRVHRELSGLSERSLRRRPDRTGPLLRLGASTPRWCSPATSQGSRLAARSAPSPSGTARPSRRAACSSPQVCRYRLLQAPGLGELTGRGVYYGATASDARQCEGDDVYIVGAANSAGQAALNIARYARRVTMLVRSDALEKSMSQYLVKRISAADNIDVRLHAEVASGHGDGHLESVTIADVATGTQAEVPASWLFVFIGAAPRTDWLGPDIARDDKGFVITGQDLVVDGGKNVGY